MAKNVLCPECKCSKYCLEKNDCIECLNCGTFKKEHKCHEHVDTAIRKSRVKYLCSVCGADVSLMYFLYQDAMLRD